MTTKTAKRSVMRTIGVSMSTLRKMQAIRLRTGQNYGFMVNAWADRELSRLNPAPATGTNRPAATECRACRRIYPSQMGPCPYCEIDAHAPSLNSSPPSAGGRGGRRDSDRRIPAGPKPQPEMPPAPPEGQQGQPDSQIRTVIVCPTCSREFDTDLPSCPFCTGGES